MFSICDRFQFLKPSELLDLSENESAWIRKLTSPYSNISSDELIVEANRLRGFVKSMTERGVCTESALRETVGGINPKYSTEGEKEHDKRREKEHDKR